MAKHTIIFDLNEPGEKEELKLHQAGPEVIMGINEVYRRIRDKIKYDDLISAKEKKVYQEVKELLLNEVGEFIY